MSTDIPITRELLDRLFMGLRGIPSWGVRKGYSSFVTFDFGQPKLEIGEIYRTTVRSSETKLPCSLRPTHIRGEWHLWIYCCDWEILHEGGLLAHSESEDVQINRACGYLNGQAVTAVTVSPVGVSQWSFDLGGLLKTSPYDNGELQEQWRLFCPEQYVLTYRGDGAFSYRLHGGTAGDEFHRFAES